MSKSSISASVFMPSSELRRASRAAVWSALWSAVAVASSTFAKRYAEHRRAKRAIAELSGLSDRMLKDIGLDRGDIPRIVYVGRDSGEIAR